MNFVKTRKDHGVLHVSLARPERMNAFDQQMIAELTAVFKKIDGDVRAILLTGEGKSFCAGADLEYMKEMAKYSREKNVADSEALFEMFYAIRFAPVPVVSSVQGSVFAGGVGLVAACDWVAAEAGAQFCFSEVRLGLIPAVISTFVMSKMTPGFARAMMVSGMTFSAEQALASGLVYFTGNALECASAVQQTLRQLLANGPEAMKKTKNLCEQVSATAIDDFKKLTTATIADQRVSAEGQEGLSAFLSKRKASWFKDLP